MGCRFLGWRLFSFSPVKISHSPGFCRTEELGSSLAFVPLKIICLFFFGLVVLTIFFFSLSGFLNSILFIKVNFSFICLVPNSLALLIYEFISSVFWKYPAVSLEILSLPVPSFLSSYALIRFMLDLITVFSFSVCCILDNSSDSFSSLFILCFCYVQSVCCQIYVKFSILVTKFSLSRNSVWFTFKSAMSLSLVFCSLRIYSSLSFVCIW